MNVVEETRTEPGLAQDSGGGNDRLCAQRSGAEGDGASRATPRLGIPGNEAH